MHFLRLRLDNRNFESHNKKRAFWAKHKNDEERSETMKPEKRIAATTEKKAQPWKELIRQYKNGDKNSICVLNEAFEPLLNKEASRMMKTGRFQEFDEAKSQTVLFYLEFIDAFSKWDLPDAKIPGLLKKYLHDSLVDFLRVESRHCPPCYTVDFAAEVEANSPFSKLFPVAEMDLEEALERQFRNKALREAMQQLTKKEIFIVKKIVLENKPPSSVAQEFHCSTRYVRRLRQHALEKMRLYLETHYPSLRFF